MTGSRNWKKKKVIDIQTSKYVNMQRHIYRRVLYLLAYRDTQIHMTTLTAVTVPSAATFTTVT